MSHSFLQEQGIWSVRGYWLERDRQPLSLEGKFDIAWQDNWFTMSVQLTYVDSAAEAMWLKYRGRIDNELENYSYVVQHSLLGRVEGEGRLGLGTICQRYWVLGDRQRRSGWETYYRIDDRTYQFVGAIATGHSLSSTVEATLSRHR